MTTTRHPNGTHTDEYRAALFAGPQALERFHQSASSSLQLEAEPMGRPQAPAPPTPRRRLLNSAAHLYGFMQATDPLYSVQDALATWQQHLQIQLDQVLLLPIEICAWLLANQPPGTWTSVSAYPSTLAPDTDPGTGLDTLSVQTSGTWGVTADGQPYFTPDGEVGSGENAVLVVSAGQPALIQ